MPLFFLTIPKPLKQYTLLKNITHSAHIHELRLFAGCAFPCNDIGGVTSSFQCFSSGGDCGSRMFFAGERGGGRNATATKTLK